MKYILPMLMANRMIAMAIRLSRTFIPYENNPGFRQNSVLGPFPQARASVSIRFLRSRIRT
jgi:hypothetical protein